MFRLTTPRFKLYSAILLLLVISGCTTAPKDILSASGYSWQNHQLNFPYHHWQFTGKIAFLGKKKQSANIFWQRQQGVTKVKLTSFIGTSLLNIEQQGHTLTLKADGKQYQGLEAQRLIERVTGLPLSLQQISRWLMFDIPLQRIEWTEQGIPKRYQPFADWTVEYRAFSEFNQWLLPNGMTVISPTGKIKLSINKWTL